MTMCSWGVLGPTCTVTLRRLGDDATRAKDTEGCWSAATAGTHPLRGIQREPCPRRSLGLWPPDTAALKCSYLGHVVWWPQKLWGQQRAGKQSLGEAAWFGLVWTGLWASSLGPSCPAGWTV